MSKVLLLAFLICSIFFIPTILTLKTEIQQEFSKFTAFQIETNISQSAPINIPQARPWIVVDTNTNLTLTEELFVIDNENVHYRFLNKGTISQMLLKSPGQAVPRVSSFATILLLMWLPGIVLFLYLRMWIKYFLIVFLTGTLFFIIMELTRFKLKWKQMLNVAAHASTLVILIEVIMAAVSTTMLIPLVPFLGIKIYALSLALLGILMIFGIVGCKFEDKKKKK